MRGLFYHRRTRVSKHFVVTHADWLEGGCWLTFDTYNFKPQNLQEAYECVLEKWSLLASGQFYLLGDGGSDSCGFCQYTESCRECPIYIATSRRHVIGNVLGGCNATPYYHYPAAIRAKDQQVAVVVAREMLEFLLTLEIPQEK